MGVGGTSPLISKLAELGEQPILAYSRGWALTQHLNLYQQLVYGIRYLDLRVAWDEKRNKFRFHHSLWGDDFEAGLQQIKKFIDAYPKELVLIELDLTAPAHLIKKGTDLLLTYLKSKQVPSSLGLSGTYQDYVKSGKTVFIFSHADPSFLNPQLIKSTWANTDELKKLIQVQESSVKEYRHFPGRLYRLEWVLTPSDSTIARGLVPGATKTLEDLAKKVNPELDNFVLRMLPHTINIISLDYPESSSLIQLIRELNNKPVEK
jgi:hypothetical protein